MPKLLYGNTTIEYDIEYHSNSKDLRISVEWMKGVTVKVPHGLEENQLQTILKKKAPWILQKLKQVHEITVEPQEKEYVSGEKFPYLGRHYRLKVHQKEDVASPTLHFSRGKFIVEASPHMLQEDRRLLLRQLFKDWYIAHAEPKIAERTAIYASYMNVTPTKIQLKEQQMRWGTCTNEGVIYLNWKLILAPIAVIDYVLVHELAHLRHMNHGKEYWELVHAALPDYEKRKEWLRINGPLLHI